MEVTGKVECLSSYVRIVSLTLERHCERRSSHVSAFWNSSVIDMYSVLHVPVRMAAQIDVVKQPLSTMALRACVCVQIPREGFLLVACLGEETFIFIFAFAFNCT